MLALAVLAAVALAWLSWRYAWWRPPVDTRRPRILMYHMIAEPRPGARYNGLRVAPHMFERQLAWLTRRGWHSFTVSELLQQGDTLPDRSFAITFDDGYADNFHQALPILRKYRCKATLYLVVQRFDRDWSVQRKAHHDDGELAAEAKLTDEQVQAMLDSGLVELGSHSLTHADFSRLDSAAASRELDASRRQLQHCFNVPVNSFAYPFGSYRPEQVALVRQAGYSSAVTTCEGVEAPAQWQPLELRRVKISGRDNWLAFLLRMRGGRRGWR